MLGSKLIDHPSCDMMLTWRWFGVRCCLQYYFHHRNAVSIDQLMKETYHIMDSTPTDIHPQTVLEDFTPLTKGQYPIFNKYPKFIVDYQVSRWVVMQINDNTPYPGKKEATVFFCINLTNVDSFVIFGWTIRRTHFTTKIKNYLLILSHHYIVMT